MTKDEERSLTRAERSGGQFVTASADGRRADEPMKKTRKKGLDGKLTHQKGLPQGMRPRIDNPIRGLGILWPLSHGVGSCADPRAASGHNPWW